MSVQDSASPEKKVDKVIVRHVRADFGAELNAAPAGAMPVKEFSANGPNSASRKAEGQTGAPDMPGRHVVFVLARQASGEYPVVKVPEQDGIPAREAIMFFTQSETATLYVQVARTAEYAIKSLAPQEAVSLVHSVRSQGIEWIIVDPNRRHQEDGRSGGAVIQIAALDHDPSGENLYQEFFHVTNGQPIKS